MLDEARFWQIIDSTRQQALARPRAPGQDLISIHEETLADALRRLPPDDIAAFNERFWSIHASAYRWDLWGAAYWLLGGCGNDGFTDFRASLISLGKDLFHQVVANPDTLADLEGRADIPYLGAEGFQYIAGRVYKKETGKDMPDLGSAPGPSQPVGTKLQFGNKEVMRKHYPRLVEKLPEMGD